MKSFKLAELPRSSLIQASFEGLSLISCPHPSSCIPQCAPETLVQCSALRGQMYELSPPSSIELWTCAASCQSSFLPTPVTSENCTFSLNSPVSLGHDSLQWVRYLSFVLLTTGFPSFKVLIFIPQSILDSCISPHLHCHLLSPSHHPLSPGILEPPNCLFCLHSCPLESLLARVIF